MRRRKNLLFEAKDADELKRLVRAERRSTKALLALPKHQAEWFALWRYVVGQRWGVGMAVGELVHSEVERDLRRKRYRGDDLDRVMDIVLETDEIFREYAKKAENTSRTTQNEKSLDGAKSLIMGRSQEMAKGKEGERKSKAV